MAGAVLVRDNLVLLGLRSAARAAQPGRWDIPGGHVEAGETPEQALVRELREELGIAVRPASGPTVIELEPGTELWVWTLREWSGDLRNAAPHEHDRFQWFTGEEVGNLPLADPRLRGLVTRAVQ